MNDLAELFARDPLNLTKDDIKSIIEEMRKSRHAFCSSCQTPGGSRCKFDLHLTTRSALCTVSSWFDLFNGTRDQLYLVFLRIRSVIASNCHQQSSARMRPIAVTTLTCRFRKSSIAQSFLQLSNLGWHQPFASSRAAYWRA